MRRVLEEIIIDGVKTNIQLMYLLTCRNEFIRGGYDTSVWGRIEKDLKAELAEVSRQA